MWVWVGVWLRLGLVSWSRIYPPLVSSTRIYPLPNLTLTHSYPPLAFIHFPLPVFLPSPLPLPHTLTSPLPLPPALASTTTPTPPSNVHANPNPNPIPNPTPPSNVQVCRSNKDVANGKYRMKFADTAQTATMSSRAPYERPIGERASLGGGAVAVSVPGAGDGAGVASAEGAGAGAGAGEVGGGWEDAFDEGDFALDDAAASRSLRGVRVDYSQVRGGG